MECKCPDWWFPAHRREELKALPHNYMGALAHHKDCPKTKDPWKGDPREVLHKPTTFWERLEVN